MNNEQMLREALQKVAALRGNVYESESKEQMQALIDAFMACEQVLASEGKAQPAQTQSEVSQAFYDMGYKAGARAAQAQPACRVLNGVLVSSTLPKDCTGPLYTEQPAQFCLEVGTEPGCRYKEAGLCVNCSKAQPAEPVAVDHSDLIKRIDAAIERVTQGRGLMSIPADPRSDVDLVLSECKALLEGKNPPFWATDFHPAQPVQPAGAQVEVVGWIFEDDLSDEYPYDALFPYSKVDVVRMFPVFAPNPAAAINEQDRRDAARYQWLRNSGGSFDISVRQEDEEGKYWITAYSPNDFDLAIDAAIAAAEAAKEAGL